MFAGGSYQNMPQARLLLTPASDQSSGHRSPARMNSTAQTKALIGSRSSHI